MIYGHFTNYIHFKYLVHYMTNKTKILNHLMTVSFTNMATLQLNKHIVNGASKFKIKNPKRCQFTIFDKLLTTIIHFRTFHSF